MTFSPILERVANGRRMAARSIVLSHLGAIPCQVWRKKIVPASSAHPDRHEEVFQGIAVLSDSDDHAFEFEPIGYAKLLLDGFTGTIISSNRTMVDGEGESFVGQIEPYDPDLEPHKRVLTIPEWQVKNGDLFALLLSEHVILWLEIVSPLGQTLIADFGAKYILNKRDELTYIQPMKSEFESRT